jgi:SAM-dependent methyltransferase
MTSGPSFDSAFDTEGLFDDDYLYFYATRDPGGELSDAETDLIWHLLDLEAGMAVLDLACGHGRIANRLAARGAEVAGLDVTPRFLELAREDAAARGVEVEYVQGDMRELPWTERFDRVVNWFTAFGYFDDTGNRRVLAEVARALRPGGRVAIELNNYPAIMRTYLPSTVVERDGNLMIDRHRFDPLTGRNLVERTIIRDSLVRRTHFEVRMFTYPELRDWLLEAGFAAVAGYGEDGQPLTTQHRRLIAIASLP